MVFGNLSALTIAAIAILLCLPATIESQSAPASPRDTAAKPVAKPAGPAIPPIDFSGIIFANYQYRGDDAAQSANRFDVERAYLTFRMPAGDRTSVRITTDIYQQQSSGSDAYYRGWSVRMKYAYLQYNYLTPPGVSANARLGMLHTVFIEHDEKFWPRWLATSPTDRNGYLSSADMGLANTVTLPGNRGEIYSTITNGPGYISRETDRFKDFATRVTIAPWASNSGNPLRSLALTGWAYKGAVASRFVNGGTGQVGSVGESLKRDRWGVHAGFAAPWISGGAQYAERIEEGEDGLNTSASPRSVTDSTGSLASVYAIFRPFARVRTDSHPFAVVARLDRVTTNTDSNAAYDFIVAGLIWDFSKRASIALDYQEVSPVEGRPIAPARTWFAHFVARF